MEDFSMVENENEEVGQHVLLAQVFLELYYSFMFLLSLNVFFMILGEKEFKKPILDELGQNRTNIENWRRNLDQRVESWKNLEENPWKS